MTWRKSSRSEAAGQCVEVTFLATGAVRDSKHPAAALPVDLSVLLSAVKAGHLDR